MVQYTKQKTLTVFTMALCRHFEDICASKRNPMRAQLYTQYCNTDPFTAKRLIEPYPNKCYGAESTGKTVTTNEMDDVYPPPREPYHPVSMKKRPMPPAIEEVKFSLVSNRGCYGGCGFCALTFHQGRI